MKIMIKHLKITMRVKKKMMNKFKELKCFLKFSIIGEEEFCLLSINLVKIAKNLKPLK